MHRFTAVSEDRISYPNKPFSQQQSTVTTLKSHLLPVQLLLISCLVFLGLITSLQVAAEPYHDNPIRANRTKPVNAGKGVGSFVLRYGTVHTTPPLEIRGRVINSKGEPVQGATIAIKSTGKVSVTDENGMFSINAKLMLFSLFRQ
jgi:hypothetical protein